MACDGLASRPEEVEILLAASCYRNRDKLRQLWASGLQGFFTSSVRYNYVTLSGNVNNLQRDDVKPVDRKPTKEGCSFNMQSVKFLVVSSFGLYATLLWQWDLPPDGFVRLAKFIPVVDALNGIALDECEPLCSLGRKSFLSNRGPTNCKNCIQ